VIPTAPKNYKFIIMNTEDSQMALPDGPRLFVVDSTLTPEGLVRRVLSTPPS